MADTCPAKAESPYRQRHPEKTPFYAVLYHYFDEFKAVYDDMFQEKYGRWRHVISQVVSRFLECGVAYNGFARIKCESCKTEAILPYSCKCRSFCPSCSAKRAELWAELVREEVLQNVAHQHVVFSLPKMFRACFRFHRELLPELAQCAWRVLRLFFQETMPGGGMPAAIIAISTSGDMLRFNPHCHSLVASGTFCDDGSFESCPVIEPTVLRRLFEAEVFTLLLRRGLIDQGVVDKIRSWKHTGFDCYVGPHINDVSDAARVGQYMIRAPAAPSRLGVDEQKAELKYVAKGHTVQEAENALFEPPSERFGYLEWIARLTQHIPDKGMQMVHYMGAYSNAHRGKMRKPAQGGSSNPATEPPSETAVDPEWLKDRRRSWARLIKRVFNCDPLKCPKCGGRMRIVAFLDDQKVVDRILKHIKYRLDVMPLPKPPAPPRQLDLSEAADCPF